MNLNSWFYNFFWCFACKNLTGNYWKKVFPILSAIKENTSQMSACSNYGYIDWGQVNRYFQYPKSTQALLLAKTFGPKSFLPYLIYTEKITLIMFIKPAFLPSLHRGKGRCHNDKDLQACISNRNHLMGRILGNKHEMALLLHRQYVSIHWSHHLPVKFANTGFGYLIDKHNPFQDLPRYICLKGWNAMLDFMIVGLELYLPDTSWFMAPSESFLEYDLPCPDSTRKTVQDLLPKVVPVEHIKKRPGFSIDFNERILWIPRKAPSEQLQNWPERSTILPPKPEWKLMRIDDTTTLFLTK